MDMSNFRPLNNLPILEKIIEEHIKVQMTEFLETNEIINENHHGGLKNHSTITALAQIQQNLYQNWENSLIGVTMTTDLSSAYDTIDHSILLKKLNHYGFTDKSNNLIKSYLSNRKQLIVLDNQKSIIRDSLPCSCVQGSKLSGHLYTIYVNELPLLKELMGTEFFTTITTKRQKPYKNIKHDTISYVDDSTNIIAGKEPQYISNYIADFYILMETYYFINKLKINDDKSEMIITCNNKLKAKSKSVIFMANNFKIKPKEFLIILGFRIQKDLNNDKQINFIKSKVTNRLHTLNMIRGFSDYKTRLKIANAIIIGSLQYGIPLFLNLTKEQLKTLNSLMIRAARIVKMFKTLKWVSIYNLIQIGSIKLFNKTMMNPKPHVLKKFYKQVKTKRYCKTNFKYILIHKTRTNMTINGFMNKSSLMYNYLPQEIRDSPTPIFNTKLKEFIGTNFPFSSLDKDMEFVVT